MTNLWNKIVNTHLLENSSYMDEPFCRSLPAETLIWDMPEYPESCGYAKMDGMINRSRIQWDMDSIPAPNWLEIDLSVVENNVCAVRNITAVDVMAVIKANAYGYGTVPIARAAVNAGAVFLGTARVEEALTLRSAGFAEPILVLGMVPFEQINLCISRSICLPVSSFEIAQVYGRLAAELGVMLNVHLKLDTGMGRLGVFADQALSLAQTILDQPLLHLDGMYSHLANADRLNDPSVYRQIERFKLGLGSLHSAGIYPKWVHLANSAAALGYPEAVFNLVRGAQMLVGHNSFSDRPLHPKIQRAMHAWKARLVSCWNQPAGSRIEDGFDYVSPTDEVIGMVSVGFGDGYWRQSGSQVLVGGIRQPVIGLPAFDTLYVRLNHPYPSGSEVMLCGTQGEETITIEDLARCWKTGPGKITSVIPEHVPRIYSGLLS